MLAANGDDACAVTTGGVIRCWGTYELAIGPFVFDSTVTVSAPLLSGVKKVALSGVSTCALTVMGIVWCWGDPQYGVLGIGPTTASGSVEVTALGSGVRDIAPYGLGTCALLST